MGADIMVSVRLMLMLGSTEDTMVVVSSMEVVYTMVVIMVVWDTDIMVSVRQNPRLTLMLDSTEDTMVDTMDMLDTMVDTPIHLITSMDEDHSYQNGHGQPTTYL